ncbi:hypothetical protein [Gelidibacter sp.]|uniref:hypothetical protein n=1 Tax=Gelidibacter sp. TaxID=2018083 RepID=UPI002C1D47A3|nr:hypothetical protein [Gelidibacter sp.]HUH28926.1 hypothetical protein [Gelidibacter sp.]
MNKKINSIVQIFPDFEEKIDFLFQTDENFRDLCSDYILCAAMVQKMMKDLKKETSNREEYEELQQNLEEEILQILTKDRH